MEFRRALRGKVKLKRDPWFATYTREREKLGSLAPTLSKWWSVRGDRS